MTASRALVLITVLLTCLNPARADEPAPSNVAEIQARHDRALIRDLADYLAKNPKADDLEQAYMTLFNKVIDHDWFAAHEAIARRYLAEHADGAVRPLALIVTAMARAQAGKFDDALRQFEVLLRGLDRPEQEEFAVNFADALAGAATTAGDYASARKVLEALGRKFDQSPPLQQKVRDDLARLDRVGTPAPKVEVSDLDGKPVRLSDLRGKYVLVEFWATWCAPCVAELPQLRAAYAKYRDKGFEVVAVSLDEAPAAVADFARARKLPWRQVHNASCGGDLVEAFGVGNIPASFLIGPDGVITRLDLHGQGLDQALGSLLK